MCLLGVAINLGEVANNVQNPSVPNIMTTLTPISNTWLNMVSWNKNMSILSCLFVYTNICRVNLIPNINFFNHFGIRPLFRNSPPEDLTLYMLGFSRSISWVRIWYFLGPMTQSPFSKDKSKSGK